MYLSFLHTILLINILLSVVSNQNSAVLSNYDYPKQDIQNKILRVAIMGTNDVHGEIFPNIFQTSDGVFASGGSTNIYRYATALRKEWGDYFLWLDGGDQFQGTMECMLSDGNIMKDFYNYAKIDAIAIGNHEFDYGVDNLKNYIAQEQYPTLCANLYDKKQQKYVWEEGMWANVKPYEIYTLGKNPEVKIGVIGLATQETIAFTSTDLSDYSFDNYFEVTKRFVEKLRNEDKVDAIVLLTHFGPRCPLEPIEKMKLGMRNKKSYQKECEENQEIMEFLQQLEKEEIKIDALVGAHVHDVVHHWINGVPIIESSGAGYFNVIYLPFKINNDGSLTIINEDVEIEGPVPVCEKIWEDTRNCIFKENVSPTEMKDIEYHGSILEEDKELTQILKPWFDIVGPKMYNILAKTETEIALDEQNETILTNLINDIGRAVTGADICFYNSGGIRHQWHKGGITEIDVFKMFPFNNSWVMFDMTGEEVIRLFKDVNRNVIYPATGVIQTYLQKNMGNVLRDIELWDGIKKEKIDLKKTYKVCTNDFLANGGSGMGKVRKWYDLRNPEKIGIIRDSVIQYFRAMKIIKLEFYINPDVPLLTFLSE